MFAPNYNTCMKYAAPVRKEIGARHHFQHLGPLANPAFATLQRLGVYDKKAAGADGAGAFKSRRPARQVVHGDDGLDEITLTTTTSVMRGGGGRCGGTPWTRGIWSFPSAARRSWRAVRPPTTSKSPRRSSRAKRGPGGTWCCSTHRPACIRPERPRRLKRGWPCRADTGHGRAERKMQEFCCRDTRGVA
jgi:anthranilate phosphoribosyltransferase